MIIKYSDRCISPLPVIENVIDGGLILVPEYI